MEFTRAQIAGLVLGYLKSEKCFGAFNSFVDVSEHFQNNRQAFKMGKCFPTRVAGKCLVEYLEEYANVYSIVQGRLEATNYYNEKHSSGALIDQILYLLDSTGVIENSTPILSTTSEVETTPAHTLPGNNRSEDSQPSLQRTPKRKFVRSRSVGDKSLEKNETLEVSGLLNCLLGSHELQEKLADTINFVRNTPNVANSSVPDESIGAGASNELDAVIKAVVQRTEEDPMYHKLIDEIIGTSPPETLSATKRSQSHNNSFSSVFHQKPTPPASSPQQPPPTETIEEHNNDAVLSLIAAAHTTETTQSSDTSTKTDCNSEVYVFDGTLDTYLKTSGTTSAVPQNSVYINTGGLFVMPPYIMNNPPLINVSTDIMSMPTVILSEDSNPKKGKKIAPKPKPKQTVTSGMLTFNKTQTAPPVTNVSKFNRPPAAVRNLDFSTPSCRKVEVKKNQTRTWDEDLRSLAGACADAKVTTPKRKRVVNSRPRAKKPVNKINSPKKIDKPDEIILIQEDDEKEKAAVVTISTAEEEKDKNKTQQTSEEQTTVTNCHEDKNEKQETLPDNVVIIDKTPPDKEIPVLSVPEDSSFSTITIPQLETPLKDMIPKTPCFGSGYNEFHCTPMTEVLEEHLKGVDLMSMPTPQFPITPGFGLTPAEHVAYNRSTDYSTSSSYYQPSDTEQNGSIEKLVEECRAFDSEHKAEKFTNLRILSDVVIELARKVEEPTANCQEVLKNFNSSVIGKKNLNLLKSDESSSTSSYSGDSDSSDSDSNRSDNKTVICQKKDTEKSDVETISDIISATEVKLLLQSEPDKTKRDEMLLRHLDEKRKSVINNLEEKKPVKKCVRNNKKTIGKNVTKKRKTSKESFSEETDEEAKKTVKELALRGIHLIPNKSPTKKSCKAGPSKRRKSTSKPIETEESNKHLTTTDKVKKSDKSKKSVKHKTSEQPTRKARTRSVKTPPEAEEDKTASKSSVPIKRNRTPSAKSAEADKTKVTPIENHITSGEVETDKANSNDVKLKTSAQPIKGEQSVMSVATQKKKAPPKFRRDRTPSVKSDKESPSSDKVQDKTAPKSSVPIKRNRAPSAKSAEANKAKVTPIERHITSGEVETDKANSNDVKLKTSAQPIKGEPSVMSVATEKKKALPKIRRDRTPSVKSDKESPSSDKVKDDTSSTISDEPKTCEQTIRRDKASSSSDKVKDNAPPITSDEVKIEKVQTKTCKQTVKRDRTPSVKSDKATPHSDKVQDKTPPITADEAETINVEPETCTQPIKRDRRSSVKSDKASSSSDGSAIVSDAAETNKTCKQPVKIDKTPSVKDKAAPISSEQAVSPKTDNQTTKIDRIPSVNSDNADRLIMETTLPCTSEKVASDKVPPDSEQSNRIVDETVTFNVMPTAGSPLKLKISVPAKSRQTRRPKIKTPPRMVDRVPTRRSQRQAKQKSPPVSRTPPRTEATPIITIEDTPEPKLNESLHEDVVFDKRSFEDSVEVVFAEHGVKVAREYDVACLSKGIKAQVFIEELNEEVERTMKWTDFEIIVDLPTKILAREDSKTEMDIDDELMDYAVAGSREESPVKPCSGNGTSKGSKKRKRKSSEEGEYEKKSKRLENNIKLLKKIDVDSFLDKVHGE